MLLEIAFNLTPAMREAGITAYEKFKDSYPSYLLVEEIFKAMSRAETEARRDKE